MQEIKGTTIGFDDRYHCNYCSYDTQLPNKMESHLLKKHWAAITLLEAVEPELVEVQDPELDPETAKENLENEES